MSLTNLLVPAYAQMLRALSGWLDKACKQLPGEEAEALLGKRLAPDMLPLASQVRFACYQAQEATFRLRGEPLPESLEDVARAGRELVTGRARWPRLKAGSAKPWRCSAISGQPHLMPAPGSRSRSHSRTASSST